jgi:ABC-type nickel/cobalt efflux system permease component RcnA
MAFAFAPKSENGLKDYPWNHDHFFLAVHCACSTQHGATPPRRQYRARRRDEWCLGWSFGACVSALSDVVVAMCQARIFGVRSEE